MQSGHVNGVQRDILPGLHCPYNSQIVLLFNSTALFEYFSQFLWYWPEESIEAESLYEAFPERIKTYIEKIKELENEKIMEKKNKISRKLNFHESDTN